MNIFILSLLAFLFVGNVAHSATSLPLELSMEHYKRIFQRAQKSSFEIKERFVLERSEQYHEARFLMPTSFVEGEDMGSWTFQRVKFSPEKETAIYRVKDHSGKVRSYFKVFASYHFGAMIMDPRLYKGKLIVGIRNDMNGNYGVSELHQTRNSFDLREKTKVHVSEGLLHKDGKVLTFNVDPQDGVDCRNYVVDKRGDLYVKVICNHSWLRKQRGVGKSVQCAGKIGIVNGKIAYMDNDSGHYKPNEDQLLLCAYNFFKAGLLANDVVIRSVAAGKFSIKDIKLLNAEEILSKYREVDPGVVTSGDEDSDAA